MGFEIYLLGAFMVGLSLIIAGFISIWRDKRSEKQS